MQHAGFAEAAVIHAPALLAARRRPRPSAGGGGGGGTGDAAPPVAIGMWATKSELDAIAASGATWSGSGEVHTVAVSFYRTFTISDSTIKLAIENDTHVANMRKVMAAAIVFARLKPADGVGNPEVAPAAGGDPAFTCDELRAKIAAAIEQVITPAHVPGTSETRPARQLGGWPIIADLINLPAYDGALNSTFTHGGGASTGFVGWLDYSMEFDWSSAGALTFSRGQNLTNKGSMARWSTAACEIYKRGSLGTSTRLDALAQIMRRFLGDTSIVTVAGETQSGSPASLFHGFSTTVQSDTWQAAPTLVDNTDRVGVNALGATKDGNNLDGLIPGDQYRGFYNSGDGTGGAEGDPSTYRADFFPNRYTGVDYTSVTTYAHIAAVHMLHRCGYTDLLTCQDDAMVRSIEWLKWAADNHSARGYVYFGEGSGNALEAAKPLINYLWPDAGLPANKIRTSESGAAFGYAWTWWLFSGRSL